MCTLSYIPLPEGSIITTNRDESPLRQASTLSEYETDKGETFLMAREPIHGGTNFAGSAKGNKVAVLLNGGFRPHAMGGTYRLSRGIVVLQSLVHADLFDFARNFDFAGIEPFTLFHFDADPREIRWDGKDVFIRQHPQNTPFIVASAQLYRPQDQLKRKLWFEALLSESDPTPERVFDFHIHGGDGNPETDMVMRRDHGVCTVSISQVSAGSDRRVIRHLNLVEKGDRSWKFRK